MKDYSNIINNIEDLFHRLDIINSIKEVINGIQDHIPITWELLLYRFMEWKKDYKDSNFVGFTYVESSEPGNYILLQGMINMTNMEIKEVVRLKSKHVDADATSQVFEGKKLKLYT